MKSLSMTTRIRYIYSIFFIINLFFVITLDRESPQVWQFFFYFLNIVYFALFLSIHAIYDDQVAPFFMVASILLSLYAGSLDVISPNTHWGFFFYLYFILMMLLASIIAFFFKEKYRAIVFGAGCISLNIAFFILIVFLNNLHLFIEYNPDRIRPFNIICIVFFLAFLMVSGIMKIVKHFYPNHTNLR